MTMLIRSPPKIYLDTKDLICISHLRDNRNPKVAEVHHDAYRYISRCILGGNVGVVFNPAAPLEWVDGSATLENAKEVAEIIDDSPLQYELALDKFVWLIELLNECKRIAPEIKIPHWSPLLLRRDVPQPRPMSILCRACPEYFREEELVGSVEELSEDLPAESAAFHVDRAYHLKTNKPVIFRERVEGFRAALDQDIAGTRDRPAKAISQDEMTDWMRRYLQIDVVLAALNPSLDVHECLRQVELKHCPAVKLYVSAREQRIRESRPAKDNDGDDWSFLPAVPYADIILCDRGFRHLLHVADHKLRLKVFSNVSDAAAKLRELVGQ